MFQYTILDKKHANPKRNSSGNYQYKPHLNSSNAAWEPPPSAWLNWNIDASQITAKKLTMIRYVCRNDKGHIVHSTGRMVGDVPILVVEVIAVRKALRVTTHFNIDNLLMEGDAQTVIISTLGKIKTPRQIINHITDIENLVRNFENIQFSY